VRDGANALLLCFTIGNNAFSRVRGRKSRLRNWTSLLRRKRTPATMPQESAASILRTLQYDRRGTFSHLISNLISTATVTAKEALRRFRLFWTT